MKASQCLRLASRLPEAKRVPTGSPAATSVMTFRIAPLHTTVAAPERAAFGAAASFVIIPPRPNALVDPPAARSISGVIDSMTP